jgi:hypothetical protein
LGTSKDIRVFSLDQTIRPESCETLLGDLVASANGRLNELALSLRGVTAEQLQSTWIHIASGSHPFEIVDLLDRACLDLASLISERPLDEVVGFMLDHLRQGVPGADSLNRDKLSRNCHLIVAGFIVGARFNEVLGRKPSELPLAG